MRSQSVYWGPLFIIALIGVFTSSDFIVSRYISLGLILAFAPIHNLSRSPHFSRGVTSLILAIFALVILTLLTAPGTLIERMLVLKFLAVGIMLSMLLLQRATALVVTVFSLGIVSVFFFVPEVPFATTYSYLVFLLLLAVLGGWGAATANQHKQRHIASEERYLGAVAASLDAFYLLESVRGTDGQIIDFCIVDVNEKAVNQAALPRETLVGGLLCELFPSNRSNGLFEQYKQVVLSDTPLTQEYTIPAEHATPRWYHQKVVKAGNGVCIINRDITEYKQLKESLKISCSLFDQGNDAVFILDLQGNHLKVNQRAADLFGYQSDEIVRLSYPDLIVTEHQQSEDIRRRLLQGEKFPPYERVFGHKSGRLIPTEVNVEVIHDDDGSPMHIQSLVRDITERKQREAELHKLRDKLRRTNSLARVGSWSKNLLTGEDDWCDITREIHEVAADFVPTMENSIAFYKEGESRQKITEVVTRLIETGEPYDVEVAFITAKGNERWIRTQGQAEFQDGRCSQIFGTFQDVTERRQVEESLRGSEARYRALLSAIPDLMFRNRRDGTYLDYHAPDPHKLFVAPEKFMGRKVQDVLSPEIAQVFLRNIQQGFQTGQEAVCEYVLPIEGQSAHFEARTIISGQDEVLTIVRDITELKQAQQKEIELILERERGQLLRQFINTASHEFRTPLTIITSAASLMVRTQDRQKQQSWGASIETQVQRITRLLDMLLTLTRLNYEAESVKQPVKIEEILEVVCQNRVSWYGDSPTLRIERPVNLPLVMGNPDNLATALTEILDNAYRFTPADGMITVTAGSEDQHIWLTIHNTGSVIAGDDLPRVFDTFWRKDKAHTTPGFGLGLSIARRIAQWHNGEIEVESAVDKGTVFKVILPSCDVT